MHFFGSQLIASLTCTILLGSSGCHVLSPRPIPAAPAYIAEELIGDPTPQIEVGRPVLWLDTAGWIWGIPSKLLLFDRRIDNHRITEPTMETTADYLAANQLPHVKVRVNQYAPIEDFHRLRKNKTVAWPYRYTLGLLAVGGEAVLPGRLIGGDHFNPFTQTVHLYSDVPAIALHELAHAKDFARRKYQGTYALAYLAVPLWHETIASQDAMDHLYQRFDREGITEANRILYPAYGTYVGNGLGMFAPSYATPIYYGAVVAGHLNGRMLSRQLEQDLQRYETLHVSLPGKDQNRPLVQALSLPSPATEPTSFWSSEAISFDDPALRQREPDAIEDADSLPLIGPW